MSDWRGKLTGAAGLGKGTSAGSGRGGNGRSSPGDVLSLVGEEKVVVEKRESLGDKFYRQVKRNVNSLRLFF